MTLKPADFLYLRDLVRRRAAVQIDDGKEYLVEARLLPVARSEGCSSLDELFDRLRGRPSRDLDRRVVEAMLNRETSFFRDFSCFEAFRTRLLPDLVAKRASSRTLRLWSAACSSGQEPYSLALVIREHFPALLGWNLRLLATDLSGEMIACARQGCYSALEVNRGLPAAFLVRYFQPQDLRWRIRDEVRRMVDFQEHNLIDAWPAPPEVDCLWLRNVLIYFDVETKKRILEKALRALRPDGYLVLGAAETPLLLDPRFEPVAFNRTVVYRRRDVERG